MTSTQRVQKHRATYPDKYREAKRRASERRKLRREALRNYLESTSVNNQEV